MVYNFTVRVTVDDNHEPTGDAVDAMLEAIRDRLDDLGSTLPMDARCGYPSVTVEESE